jgi:hypothetical protein
MLPEETTIENWDEEAFAALLKRADAAPSVVTLPPGLSERIATATYARPTLWDKLALALRPAPVRFALGGALTAGVLSALFLPRVTQPELTKKATPMAQVAVIAPKDAPLPSPAPPAEVVEQPTLVQPTPAPEKRVPVAPITASPAPVRPTPSVPPRPTPTPEPPAPRPNTSRSVPAVNVNALRDHGSVAIVPTKPLVDTPSATPAPTSAVTADPAAQPTTNAVVAPRTVARVESSDAVPMSAPLTAQPSATGMRQARLATALSTSQSDEKYNLNLGITSAQMAAERGGFKSHYGFNKGVKAGNQLNVVSQPVD